MAALVYLVPPGKLVMWAESEILLKLGISVLLANQVRRVTLADSGVVRGAAGAILAGAAVCADIFKTPPTIPIVNAIASVVRLFVTFIFFVWFISLQRNSNVTQHGTGSTTALT
jgi:hypothetical protein